MFTERDKERSLAHLLEKIVAVIGLRWHRWHARLLVGTCGYRVAGANLESPLRLVTLLPNFVNLLPATSKPDLVVTQYHRH